MQETVSDVNFARKESVTLEIADTF